MDQQRRPRTLFDHVLVVLLVLAIILLAFNILETDRLSIASSFLLALGLVAFLQWRRYNSRRWRTIAWISFALALAALLFRVGLWAEWIAP